MKMGFHLWAEHIFQKTKNMVYPLLKLFFKKSKLVLSFIFISLFCSIGYILSRKFDNSISILLVQIIFLTSSTFINYSFRPKQYVYDFLIVVALIYFLDNYKYSLIKLIMLTILIMVLPPVIQLLTSSLAAK